jgi:hypothetical protein
MPLKFSKLKCNQQILGLHICQFQDHQDQSDPKANKALLEKTENQEKMVKLEIVDHRDYQEKTGKAIFQYIINTLDGRHTQI